MPDNLGSTWSEYKEHVVRELERLADAQEGIEAKMEDIRVEIAVLKTKAGIWGAVSGFLVSAVVSAIVSRLL